MAAGWPPWEGTRDCPVTDTAPINPLQQRISALNNTCKCEIHVLQSLTRIVEWTGQDVLCSTHTYLCFIDRSHASQNVLAAIGYIYVYEYRGFREEGKHKMEKWGSHCNLPLWEKVSLSCTVGAHLPWLKAKKLHTVSHDGANGVLLAASRHLAIKSPGTGRNMVRQISSRVQKKRTGVRHTTAQTRSDSPVSARVSSPLDEKL